MLFRLPLWQDPGHLPAFSASYEVFCSAGLFFPDSSYAQVFISQARRLPESDVTGFLCDPEVSVCRQCGFVGTNPYPASRPLKIAVNCSSVSGRDQAPLHVAIEPCSLLLRCRYLGCTERLTAWGTISLQWQGVMTGFSYRLPQPALPYVDVPAMASLNCEVSSRGIVPQGAPLDSPASSRLSEFLCCKLDILPEVFGASILCPVRSSSINTHLFPLSDPSGCDEESFTSAFVCLLEAAPTEPEAPEPLLAWLTLWFDAFVRSFCLLQLLAFLRLALFACPLRARAPATNQALRKVRSGLRGAPLCLVACFCVLQAADAVRSQPYVTSGQAASASPLMHRAAGDGMPMASASAEPDMGLYATGSATIPPATPAHFEAHRPADAIDLYGPESNLDDSWQLSVRILFFQRFALDSAVDTGSVEDVEDLVELLEERHDAWEMGVSFVPVSPQPAIMDFALLIATPDLAQDMALVPVCFEVYGARGPPRLWADFCERDFTLSTALEHLAQAGPPGASVYVGQFAEPLDDGSSCVLTPGMLIRVLAPGCAPSQPRSLVEKLLHPDGFLRDSATCPLPLELRNHHLVGLAQPLAQLSVVPLDSTGAPIADAADLASQIARDWGPVRLMWPASPVRDVLIRGEHVHNIVGLFPRAVYTSIPVLVDGRHFCLPFQIYASKQGTMLLSEFLANIGLVLPGRHTITVTGTAPFDPVARTILIRAADVVVLHPGCRTGAEHAGGAPDHSDHDGDDEGGRQRSRGPVSPVFAGGAAPATATAAASAGGSGEAVSHADSHSSGLAARSAQLQGLNSQDEATALPFTWNQRFLHDVFSPHRAGDTSEPAGGFVQTRLSPAFLSHEMALTQLFAAPIVEQAAEVPPPVFAVEAPHLQPDGDPGVQGTADAAELFPQKLSGSESDLMRSVPVMLIVMQGPPQRHTLWFSPDETLSSFLDRALILLSVDRDLVDIFPAAPQPPVPYFVLVAAPRWLPLAGLLAFVCYVADEDIPPFVHTAAARQTLEETLPCGPFGIGRRLDVYLPPAEGGREAAEPHSIVPAAELHPGALYYFQLPSLVPPQLLDPYQHLLALPHTTAADFPEGMVYDPHPCDVALLGVAFEQFVVRFNGVGDIKQQIGRHMGMPAHDVYWHRQPQGFDTLVVSGKSVSACFGVRSIAVFGDPPRGKGIFIDPRAACKPVAYRSVQPRRLQASDICRIVDVKDISPSLMGGSVVHLILVIFSLIMA